ncbi:MAG: hypothetical protein VKL60_19495 [Sphaerospermopsis sp.]|nr:hypothetical protein [Sphaerospermopsis sp.]
MKSVLIKSNSFGILKITLVLTSLLLTNNANALDEKIDAELQPLAPLPTSISGKETVRDQISKWLKKKNLNHGEGVLPDGRTYVVYTGIATISAPLNDKNWMQSRFNAFTKADLEAKSNCATFQEQKIENELILEYKEPAPSRVKSETEKLKREGLVAEGASRIAKAIHNDVSAKSESKTLHTASLYGEKLITNIADSEIRKRGLDPNKPVDEQEIKEILSTEKFQQAVNTLAEAECSGIQTLASFESIPTNKKGEIGKVTIWTERLQIAASGMMTGNFDLIPPTEPGLPISEHVNVDLRTLLSTVGTQIVRDERGQYVLLSYAQAAPRTESSQSINQAYSKAKTFAESQIRQFMGEQIAFSSNLNAKEESSEFDNDDFSYKNESDYFKKIRSFGEQAKISGLQVAREWETRHPANNAPVVGVVVQWKPSSAKAAENLRQISKGTSKQSAQDVTSQTRPNPSEQNTSDKQPAYELQEYSGEGRSSSEF